jgi:hypothetical protein
VMAPMRAKICRDLTKTLGPANQMLATYFISSFPAHQSIRHLPDRISISRSYIEEEYPSGSSKSATSLKLCIEIGSTQTSASYVYD